MSGKTVKALGNAKKDSGAKRSAVSKEEQRRLANIEYVKKWQQNHHEEYLAYQKEYYQKKKLLREDEEKKAEGLRNYRKIYSKGYSAGIKRGLILAAANSKKTPLRSSSSSPHAAHKSGAAFGVMEKL